MVEADWTGLSTSVMAIAAFALTAGLAVFGLKAGIRVGKSVWRTITAG